MNNRHIAMDNPALLTLAEAGRRLGVSRSSVYRLIASGALPVVRPLPDAPRIPAQELERYVQSLGAPEAPRAAHPATDDKRVSLRNLEQYVREMRHRE